MTTSDADVALSARAQMRHLGTAGAVIGLCRLASSRCRPDSSSPRWSPVCSKPWSQTALWRRSVPPSNLSLLGLVRHMAEVERKRIDGRVGQ